MFDGATALRAPERFRIDLSIARGLGYYTGTVYETILLDAPDLGSVCSGGRYDDLASYYTRRRLPGVGASVGLSRLLAALRRGEAAASPAAVVVAIAPDVPPVEGIRVADAIRAAGVAVQLYPQALPGAADVVRLKKQLAFADAADAKLVVIVAPDELAQASVAVKDLGTGAQDVVTLAALPDHVRGRVGGEA